MQLTPLIGITLASIEARKVDEEIIMTSACGRKWKFWHIQDCCEQVSVEDICGDLNDLIGSPITQADEECNTKGEVGDVTSTWTFYRFATAKGQVVIRWLGESNGYYSERVDFAEITEGAAK